MAKATAAVEEVGQRQDRTDPTAGGAGNMDTTHEGAGASRKWNMRAELEGPAFSKEVCRALFRVSFCPLPLKDVARRPGAIVANNRADPSFFPVLRRERPSRGRRLSVRFSPRTWFNSVW